VAPWAGVLLVVGATTALTDEPKAYTWMASYIANIPDAVLFQDAKSYLLLTTKIMLAFGLSFELPVVLLFLAKIGVLTGHIMVTYWRHAVVVIAALAAVFAPSNEPITMLLMAVPMVGLYLASIAMVRSMEPNPDGTPRSAFWGMLLIYMAPAVILGGASWYLWTTRPKGPITPKPPTAKEQAQTEKDLLQRIEALEKRLAELEKKVK